ncbi:MAG: hypothetical protein FWC64_09405 [Treponema sp.]|nr:hypothetical protein [Treponema sp.]
MPDLVGRLAKTAAMALQFILVTSVAAAGYGFITRGSFTPAYIFPANFVVGVVIISVSLVMMILPAAIKFDKLTDHTTFTERYYVGRHMEKQKKAFGFLFLGLSIVLITGLVQMALAVLLRDGAEL